jgi:hypothetical protein
MNINTFNFEEVEFKTTTTTSTTTATSTTSTTTLIPVTTTTTTTEAPPPSPTTTTTTTLINASYKASGFPDSRANGCYIGPEPDPGFGLPVGTIFYRNANTTPGDIYGSWIYSDTPQLPLYPTTNWYLTIGNVDIYYAQTVTYWSQGPTNNGFRWTGIPDINPELGGVVTVGCS